MITYKEACEQVGYDSYVLCPIEAITVWYAYKDGMATEFSDRDEAFKLSKLVERKVVNKSEIDAWWDSRRKLEQAACEIWEEELKAEYIGDNCSEELFDACYNEAYERGHAYGHDEIASYMSDIFEFALKVRRIK